MHNDVAAYLAKESNLGFSVMVDVSPWKATFIPESSGVRRVTAAIVQALKNNPDSQRHLYAAPRVWDWGDFFTASYSCGEMSFLCHLSPNKRFCCKIKKTKNTD